MWAWVAWGDAHYNTEEMETDDVIHRPWLYETLGWLVKSDPLGVTLASDRGEDGKWRTINFIPRAMIMAEVPFNPPRLVVSTAKSLKAKKRRSSETETPPTPPTGGSVPTVPESGPASE